MKRVLLPVLIPLALLLPAVARADLVQEFDVRIKDVKPYGAYMLVVETSTYDTTGAPPSPSLRTVVHLPFGLALRPQFLRTPFVCDVDRLQQMLNPSVCQRAQIGTGTISLDVRPYQSDPIVGNAFLFLTRPVQPNAVASVVMLVLAATPNAVYDHQLLQGAFFDQPTADRRFGYRLELPTELSSQIAGLKPAIAQMQLNISGLTRTKRVLRPCTSRSLGFREHDPRCRHEISLRRTFWVSQPRCPTSRTLVFESDYMFADRPPTHKLVGLSCRKFSGDGGAAWSWAARL